MEGLRVLVAEDNKISQQMISLMLKPTGVECVVVEDGREALEALEKREYGLVILDQNMPEMTGEEALIAIRGSGKSYSDVPVIIATGDDLVGGDEKFISAGANACLSKPLQAANLIEVMRQVLT